VANNWETLLRTFWLEFELFALKPPPSDRSDMGFEPGRVIHLWVLPALPSPKAIYVKETSENLK
jgi:hypothetical protein